MPLKKKNKDKKYSLTALEMAKFMALYKALKEMEDMGEDKDEEEEDSKMEEKS